MIVTALISGAIVVPLFVHKQISKQITKLGVYSYGYLTRNPESIDWRYILKHHKIPVNVLKEVHWDIKDYWDVMMRHQEVDAELIRLCSYNLHDRVWTELAQNDRLSVDVVREAGINKVSFWIKYSQIVNLDDLENLGQTVERAEWMCLGARLLDDQRWDVVENVAQYMKRVPDELWQMFFSRSVDEINWSKISWGREAIVHCLDDLLDMFDWTIASQWVPTIVEQDRYEQYLLIDHLNYDIADQWVNNFAVKYPDDIDWNKIIVFDRIFGMMYWNHLDILANVNVDDELITNRNIKYIRGLPLSRDERMDLTISPKMYQLHLESTGKRGVKFVESIFGNVWPQWLVVYVGIYLPQNRIARSDLLYSLNLPEKVF